jgi:hypothetical protein
MQNPLSRSRYALLAIVTALVFPAPASLSAQAGFGRVVNLPYSGGVRIMDNMWSSLGSDTKVNTDMRSGGGTRGGSVVGTSATAGASAGAKSVSQGASAAARPAAPPVPRTLSVNVRPLILSQWQAVRQQIIDSAMIYFDERDLGGGWRTSRNGIVLAEDGPMFVGWDGSGFTVKLVLKGNRLSTYLRTPTPLDRDLDPGFQVDFDVDVLMDIDIRNNGLVAGPVRLQPHVKRPEGRNVTGALATGLANLLSALTDVDFVGLMLAYVNGQNYALQTGMNRHLAQLNPVLQTASKGGAIIPGYDASSSTITLTLRRAGPAEVVR